MRRLTVLAVGLAAGCASAGVRHEAMVPRDRPADLAAPALAPVLPQSDLQSMLASVPIAAAPAVQAAGDVPAEGGPPTQRYQPPYREERLVGPNAQPEWTTERRFTTTRTYVLPPGQIELEQWARLDTPRHSGPDWFWQTGVGVGVESGFQFDVYENWKHDAGGPTVHDGVQLEGRYAFGRWDRYPLNPAIGLEYRVNHEAPDYAELRLLLADDFAEYGWLWAANAFLGEETSGPNSRKVGLSGGISRMILDSKFSVGAEARFTSTTVEHHRSDPENEFLLGPTAQWRPQENMHLDVTPLFGLSRSDRRTPRMELFLVFGIDIGPPRRDTPGANPQLGK